MEYIKKELSKLVPCCLILFLIGIIHSFGYGLILIGGFLLCEHRLTYVRWDVKDVLGHETFGVLFLIIGMLSIQKVVLAIFVLIIYFVFGKYKWEEGMGPIIYALKKIGININKTNKVS